MKKSDLLAVYKEWMEEREKKLAESHKSLSFKCSNIYSAYDLECQKTLKALEESSSPLNFFRELNFLYGEWAFLSRYAITGGGPLPENTHLDLLMEVFAEKMLREMRWEDEETLSGYYCRLIKGMPIETWDITKAWDLGRNESQAIQYILRAQYKGQEKADLEKAIRFLQRALEEMEDANS